MLINYMHALTVDLIEKYDYIPVAGADGQNILNDQLVLLQKASITEFSLICIINGDIQTETNITQTFENNLNWVKAINISGISTELVLTEILVFSGKPEALKLEVMEEHKNSIHSDKIPFEIIVLFVFFPRCCIFVPVSACW